MYTIETNGGIYVTRIKHLSGRIFQRLLQENGMDLFNGAQGRILYVLWKRDGLCAGEISRQTSLAKTTLTSMLDRMDEAGLVRRQTNPDNRRQVLVFLTEQAKAYRERYDVVSEQMNDIFYSGFDSEEIAALEARLLRIIQNLEQAERSVADKRQGDEQQ